MATAVGRLTVLSKNGVADGELQISTDLPVLQIGRERKCDIIIKVASVSRKHAKICVDENGKVSIVRIVSFLPLLC
jgi:pSer/pThr/pTyr-binding forkhead associated (FHA) protein